MENELATIEAMARRARKKKERLLRLLQVSYLQLRVTGRYRDDPDVPSGVRTMAKAHEELAQRIQEVLIEQGEWGEGPTARRYGNPRNGTTSKC